MRRRLKCRSGQLIKFYFQLHNFAFQRLWKQDNRDKTIVVPRSVLQWCSHFVLCHKSSAPCSFTVLDFHPSLKVTLSQAVACLVQASHHRDCDAHLSVLLRYRRLVQPKGQVKKKKKDIILHIYIHTSILHLYCIFFCFVILQQHT